MITIEYMAVVDWIFAYFSCPVAVHYRKFFAFTWNDTQLGILLHFLAQWLIISTQDIYETIKPALLLYAQMDNDCP